MNDSQGPRLSRLIPWPRVRITEKSVGEDFQDLWKAAVNSSKNHNHPSLAKLPYSETEARLHFLYGYCQRGQIRSDAMWRMRRADLEYIAGHTEPEPLWSGGGDPATRKRVREETVKLMANAARAKYELERRDRIANTIAVFVAGLIAAGAGIATFLLSRSPA